MSAGFGSIYLINNYIRIIINKRIIIFILVDCGIALKEVSLTPGSEE